ncbi:MAG: hypothetical protein ABI641_12420, partial [Caldimonas sp.]
MNSWLVADRYAGRPRPDAARRPRRAGRRRPIAKWPTFRALIPLKFCEVPGTIEADPSLAMADSSSQDKNLPASQRKLDKAREEG